jgi:hypothetical protein
MRLGGLRANTVRPYGTTGVGVLRDGRPVPYRGWQQRGVTLYYFMGKFVDLKITKAYNIYLEIYSVYYVM